MITKLPTDFDLENNNGTMFVEPRTDGGIGIFYGLNENTKSVAFQMSQSEMHRMIEWLINWVGIQVAPKD